MTRRRICGLARLHHGRLVPNSRNWRLHPDEQKSALEGVLGELGAIDTADVYVLDPKARAALRALPGGSAAFEKWLASYRGDFGLVDGHLRVDLIGRHDDGMVDCLVLDLDPAEADAALLTKDAIAGLAGKDQAKLESLVADLHTDNAAVQQLVDSLAGVQRDMAAGIAEAAASAEAAGAAMADGASPFLLGADDAAPPSDATPPAAADRSPAPAGQSIAGDGEAQKALPFFKYGATRLMMTAEDAAEFDAKMRAYLTEHGTLHGLAARMIRAL